MYEEVEYDGQPEQQGQSQNNIPRRQEEIDNKAISSYAVSGNKFYFVQPILKKETVAMVVKDKNGNHLEIDGQLLYEEKEISVFKGFNSKEIKLPVPAFFNDGVPSATLTGSDVEFIREIDSLVPFLTTNMVKYGKNYSGFINLLYYLKNSFTDSAKGYEGRGITMAKTTISKGEMLQTMYRKDSDELPGAPTQKKGFWDKIGGK